MDQKARMQELVKRLNETAHAYYVLGEPVISDKPGKGNGDGAAGFTDASGGR